MPNYKFYFPKGSTIQEIPPATCVFGQPHSFETLNNGLFENYGILSCDTCSSSPNSGMMVMFYRKAIKDYDSVSNVSQMGQLQLFESLNGGSHWFVPNWIIPPLIPLSGPFDLCFFSGGFDSNGGLFIFYSLLYQHFSPAYTAHSIWYVYSPNPSSPGLWSAPINCYTSPTGTLPSSTEYFAPYGHILDIYDEILGQRVLIQPYYKYDTSTGIYELNYFISLNGGITFINNPNLNPIYSGTEKYTKPSIVDLGGGDLLVMACDEGNPYQFKQFVSHDFGHYFNEDYNLTAFDSGTPNVDVASPPYLCYVNFQGIGLVVCYYTELYNNSQPLMYRAFANASDIISNPLTAWITPVLCDGAFGLDNSSGYQSFYHLINQFKGIGVDFYGDYPRAWAEIVNSNPSGLIAELQNLT